jgi:hypothetical protein
MRFLSNILNNNSGTRWAKNLRNSWLNYIFQIRNATFVDFPNDWYPYYKRAVVYSIAFNKPACVDVMLESWKIHARNTDLVIVDNSSKPKLREEIKALCAINNIPYIALPKNPEWNPNRSHALSMNWVYYNLVLNWKPHFFGFLDHDCFPFASFDLAETMEEVDLLGNKRFPKSRKYNQWNLWAGFCFYRLKRIQKININFTPSIELNLDTGGGNYNPLYRYIRDGEVIFAERTEVPNLESFSQMSYILDNRFLHTGGASHRAQKTFDSKSVLLCLKELALRK